MEQLISMLTAYDYPTAEALDQAVDILLVGDRKDGGLVTRRHCQSPWTR